MGNVHVFNQRFPALASSLFSSLSLAFLWIAGTTCSFLEVTASEGRFIENTNESFQEDITSTSFGLICESDYFDSDGDTMWLVSKVFLSLSLALGSFTTALGWILTYAIPPTGRTWKALSIVSALTAVFTIPMFLIFESEPCTIDMMRQTCSLSFGSYILIAGTLSAVAVTVLTQCVDPPQWGIELDAWKVCKRNTEVSEQLSSDNVPSAENAVGPEDPTPADAPVATAVGVLELVQCWNERRKWARSSDLEEGKAFDTSGDADDEANIPFAGAGSYYANSENSRLMLKVTPDGKLPNDERKSNASFGDLDDYIKMLEDERELGSAIGSEISTTSLDDFIENASDPEVSSQRAGQVLIILPIDAIADNDDEPERFSEEPQFYSELKPPSSTNSLKSLLQNQDEEEESSEEEDYGPRNKLSIGIRSLTNRVRDSSLLVKNSGRKYAIMDDDDEESYANSSRGKRDSATDDESNRPATPTPDSDHLHHQKLMFDWNALHAAANSGILLGQEPRSDSSDEDDPEQPYFTPNETSGDDMSNSSLGHIPDDEDDDEDSTYSGSSLSDASDDVAADVGLFIGEGVVPSPRKEKVRRGRKSNRERSSGHSVSSYTSLLEMTIDEETDMDLKEFLSSGDESMNKQLSNGYKSAPETLGGGDRGFSPYEFIQSETLPANAERGYIVSRTNAFDSSQESSLDSITRDVPVTPEKVGYRSADEETNLHSRRCRSMSIPRRKKKSSIHPLVTPPKSSLFPNPFFEDVPPEKTTPWREERLYKGGIHNPAVHIVSDDENSDEQYMSPESTRSAKSSMSGRARKARIRRLQRELEDSTTSRKRSRTLDPPKRRRQTKEASSYDFNSDLSKTGFRYDLPERDNPTLNRLLFGRDYSPDEASL